MKIIENTISNFQELHNLFIEYKKTKKWYFRGHSNPSWKLQPKIGRKEFFGVNERLVFESWKRRAIEYLKNIPDNDWQWLAIAQHHGLATRYLDWTTNPINAVFFALREELKCDAVIYAATFKYQVDLNLKNPFNIEGVGVYFPHGVVPRITRQGGLFSVHCKPEVPLEDDLEYFKELHRINIPERYRGKIFSELSYYGINSANLFPDLDGLSEFINWAIKNKEYYWDKLNGL